MNFKMQYLTICLMGFVGAIFLSSCGDETEPNLQEVSDKAKNPQGNLLDDRSTKPPKKTTDKDKPKKPKAPTPKDETVPPVTEEKKDQPIPAVEDDKKDKKDDKREDSEKKPDEQIPGCGDGKRDSKTEECDDGNRMNGDGCNSNCMSEATIVASARTRFDVGYNHACALHKGQLKCWGGNDFGQLARGNTIAVGASKENPITSLSVIELGAGNSIELVSTGGDANGSTTCIVNNRNEMMCFGANNAGQLGQGSKNNFGDSEGELGSTQTKINFSSARKVIDIDSGAQHQCVLFDNGDVKCFGLNDKGQLGQGHTDSIGDDRHEIGTDLLPLMLGGPSIAVAVGGKHSCVLTSQHKVKCFGNNASGQLGQDGVVSLGDTPYEVAALSPIALGQDAVAIAAGAAHTCAILANGSVKCWGENLDGQLGQESRNNYGDGVGEMAVLEPINLGNGKKAREIACGDNFTCVLLDDGHVKCFGANSHGQLGQDHTNNLGDEAGEMSNLRPINFGDALVHHISAGGTTACAELNDKTIRCWGNNSSGQLGTNSTTNLGDSFGDMATLSPIPLGW